MTTQSPASTDASPSNPVCQHGVSLSLNDTPHCFECEKMATMYGLPGSARMMDYPNALAFTALLKADEATNGTPAPAAVYTRPDTVTRDTVGAAAPEAPDICQCPRCTLRRSTEASARLEATAAPLDLDVAVRTPTGVERLMANLRKGQMEDVQLSGGQRMLERVVVQLRTELAEVTDDRDAFAQENFELIAKLGIASDAIDALQESEEVSNATVVELQKRLDAQTVATEAQKSNYTQMLRMYNNAVGAGSLAELIRERNGLQYSVDQLRKDLVNVRAERDSLQAKVQAVMDTVTRFG
jgi:hypothetical protein